MLLFSGEDHNDAALFDILLWPWPLFRSWPLRTHFLHNLLTQQLIEETLSSLMLAQDQDMFAVQRSEEKWEERKRFTERKSEAYESIFAFVFGSGFTTAAPLCASTFYGLLQK